MNILITVNAAWNVWNFRRPLVEALLADGYSVTVLAPLDEAASKLESIGCRVIHLPMSVKGLNPIEDVRLIFRFWRILGDLRPCTVLSFTIKNNIFGAAAARLRGIPLVPNVTGLGTAFLSGGLLERVAVSLMSAFKKFIAMDARTRAQMGQAGRARMERVYDQRIVVEAYRSAIAQLNNEGAQGGMMGHLIDQDSTQ